MFKPVTEDHHSLSDKIVEQIKEMIISGQLKPGDKLPSENELCIMFNVSRTSIREAIKILSGLGFVKIRRGLGIFVEEVDAGFIIEQLSPIIVQRQDDLLDIVRVRKVLEVHAAAWAAQNASIQEINKMEKSILRSYELIETGGTNEAISESNLNFHMILAKSTGSKVMYRIMQSLWDLLKEARLVTIRLPEQNIKAIRGHEKILEAIKNNDPENAKNIMLRHLERIEFVVSNYEINEEI